VRSSRFPPETVGAMCTRSRCSARGRVTGQFATTTGAPVDLYVFGEKQYAVFVWVGLGQGLFFTKASSDPSPPTFRVRGPTTSSSPTGRDTQETAQAVRVSFQVAGVEPNLLGVGSGLVASGSRASRAGSWSAARIMLRALAGHA